MKISEFLDLLALRWLDRRQDQAVRELQQQPGFEEIQLHKAEFGPDGFEVTMIHESAAVLADELAQMLDKNQAENYFSFMLMPRLDRGKRPVEVTVRWYNGGMTPAQKATMLGKKLKEARDKLIRCGMLAGSARAVLNDIYEFERVPDGKLLDGMERQLTELGYWPPDDAPETMDTQGENHDCLR